ncbi:hypothetical protein AAG570_012196 [Ranatra chinensis]|uniref:Kinesin-like protein n=1 Tax=Ranatra chinensis TaxID=642074 RepID=A0ABD0YI41_9HEMI
MNNKRTLKNQAQSPASSVKVFVRVRPFSEKESSSNPKLVVKIYDEKCLIFDPKVDEESFFFHGVAQRGRDINKKEKKNMVFEFDRVFDENSTNDEVYEATTKSLIASVFEGYNCSVFAYGATGAGKTFTMLGNQSQPGITYLTIVQLLSHLDAIKDTFNVTVGASYLEVYNENVRDLLHPNSPVLQLREDNGRVTVAGLRIDPINNPQTLFTLLERGNENRSQHPTDSNAESSRSHAVFQVHVRMVTKSTGQVKLSKLSMIDLAGSERGVATGCSGLRFKEGSNINKSLLALGNCINALADGLKHVPYRDSKLTRILKDSLGGNCQTVMVANVSPHAASYEDTYNTLKYANRAKSIKSKLSKNVLTDVMTIPQYKRLVEELRTKIAKFEVIFF